uniref:H15 domain-containing protein n=1 Tax=Panagrolaimus davidi TaxID=227884 RepID=A0A914QZZ4_9BILA
MTAIETAPAAAASPKPKASPKKASAKPKAAKGDHPSHPPYADMIKKAITELKEKKGSSRGAILKYISKTYGLNERFLVQVNKCTSSSSFETWC